MIILPLSGGFSSCRAGLYPQFNSMISKTILTSLAVALLGQFCLGAAPSGLIVTFKTIPERVRRDNPDLAAARLRVREAMGRMTQSGRLPNPELEASTQGNHRFREGSLEIELTQRFPVTNRLGLERGISAIEVKAAEAEIREAERLLVAEARAALVDVLAFRQQRQLRQQQADVSKQLADFTMKSASRGELSAVDAGQAKLEAARLAAEIRQLQASEVAAVGKLKPLLGMKITDVLNVSGSLPPAAFLLVVWTREKGLTIRLPNWRRRLPHKESNWRERAVTMISRLAS